MEDEVADISVKNVNKFFGDTHVIKDISLEITNEEQENTEENNTDNMSTEDSAPPI